MQKVTYIIPLIIPIIVILLALLYRFKSIKKTVFVAIPIVVILPALLFGFLKLRNKFPKMVSNQTLSGVQMRSQVWSGEITITGDVTFLPFADLTILPGTKIKFVVGDDKKLGGFEVPADGFNDLDPTRLSSYGKTHSGLTVTGKLYAVGTPENRILFTSAAENPKIADWDCISVGGDGSLIEYAIIEYTRIGIGAGDNTPHSIFRNNIVRYAMWGSISTGWSGAQVYNNEIYECGHEGVDVQGGNPIIEGNTIYDCQAGIVVLRGSATVKNNKITNSGRGPNNTGIHVGKDATPVIENNYFEAAPDDSDLKWCYVNFCYFMYKQPIGTPLLTEVYKEGNITRYAVPAYKLEWWEHNYTVKLPFEAKWLIYGWKNNKWQKVELKILSGEYKVPQGYSMYVFIPNPTVTEKSEVIFNILHKNIYKIMAV